MKNYVIFLCKCIWIELNNVNVYCVVVLFLVRFSKLNNYVIFRSGNNIIYVLIVVLKCRKKKD